MNVSAVFQIFYHAVVYRLQILFRSFYSPVAHCLSGQIEPLPVDILLLTVERKAKHDFVGNDFPCQRGGSITSWKQLGCFWLSLENMCLSVFVFIQINRVNIALYIPLCRNVNDLVINNRLKLDTFIFNRFKLWTGRFDGIGDLRKIIDIVVKSFLFLFALLSLNDFLILLFLRKILKDRRCFRIGIKMPFRKVLKQRRYSLRRSPKPLIPALDSLDEVVIEHLGNLSGYFEKFFFGSIFEHL